MPRLLPENQVAIRPRKIAEEPSSLFPGFQAPTSNTTYTPNQFFDVVIPHFSRGVVRIVAYLIRKTLGWCDANGNPQEEQILASYSELVRKAGVNRDMIRSALDDAIAGRLITCVQEGRRKAANDAGQTARYQLCWSAKAYTTRPAEFLGFFEDEGNRTDIPNEFFDVIVPNEPLSVIKVVGSIIRFSIGFQAKHGRRRQQVALSYQQISNYGRFGSDSDLAKALRIALKRHYVIRIEEGIFSPDRSLRRSATYAVCWRDSLISRKNVAAVEQSEKRSSNGRISEAADQSEKRSTLKTKPENETGKQPGKAADLNIRLDKLKTAGFSEAVAKKLAAASTLENIENQIAWLPRRPPARNPLGLLRRAVEERWEKPPELRAPEVFGDQGVEFARHFYAAFGGNTGEPVNEPSPRDAEAARSLVHRLVEACDDDARIPEWGRMLAQAARQQRHPFPSLQLAIRQLGDGLLSRLQREHREARRAAAEAARTAHETRFRQNWLAWIAEQEQALAEQPDYSRFVEKRQRDRAEIAASHAPWAKTMLAVFNTNSSRLEAFRQFFDLPDFWRWDATINNQPFNPTL